MSSLVAYYQIRGGDGNTLFDLSCNGRNLVANSGFYNYNIFDHANVQDKRPIVKETKSIVPNHALVTEYKYNSLGKVFWQKTPDADVSEFFYDRLGRLVISQNAEQKLPMVVDANNPANRFSYTKYDQLGRITEVGERLSSTAGVSADNTRNDSWLSSWMFSGTVRQSTRTLYDFGNSIGINSELANNNVLVNGRNRVVAVLYIPTGTNPNGRSSATYYSYDLMGSVKDLYQENIGFGAKQATLISNGSRLKRINYEYDLISGKVNYVHYQPGKWDQFHYYYNYDAENRLTEAWTSRVPGQRPSDLGDIHWTRDAQYSYYLHGPLSQMLLGKNLVQGLDYAYTLQGWLKGVNGQYLDPTRDMGKHGTGPLATIPRDNLAFSLGYNQVDYSPIGQSSANAFTLQYNGAHTGSGAGVDLYNGNIRNTTYAIRGIRAGEPTAYAYRYDQLNRLKLHLSFGLTSNTTTWNLSSTNLNYDEQFVYDPNGNITQAKRKGGATGWIDDLTYHYNIDLSTGDLVDNRLNYVSDVATNPAGGGDIRNQSFGNYVYDRIGNLIIDNQPEANERITKIEWTVYGKIQSVQKHNGDLIVYSYDPSGNRIQKSVTSGGVTLVTYYVRDAQGNVMAVYESTNTSLTWKEQHLYGSSRLGVALPNIVINSTQVLSNDSYAALGTDGFNNGVEGKRRYELSNHLGNVLVTITDRKFWNGVQYESELITSQQYYAFGMLMPGMQFGASGNYRYGFNGKEMDNEVSGTGNQYDYGFRIYNPNLGRFLTVDPLTKKYPMLTPYQFSSNSPIQAVDVDGLEGVQYTEIQTDRDGNTVIKRVVEVDVYVAISRDKESQHFYSKNPKGDLKVQSQVIGDLKSQFPDNTFKDDEGNDVIWRFNVKLFQVDKYGSVETKYNELRNNPAFKVVPEGGGKTQYRGFILQRQLINPEVIPTEPGEEGAKEGGNLTRFFIVTINSQFYNERTQRPHTIGHETTHFFLRLHPDKSISSPDNTAEGHAAAGGGILNYGTVYFRFPGQIRTSTDERVIVTFEGLKPLSQTNVTNILQSVPEKREPTKQ